MTTPHHRHPRPGPRGGWGSPDGGGAATGRVVLAGVTDGDPDPALRAALATASAVAAPRALLAAHRGLVPASAVVEVLPDTALADPGGVRIDLPEQGGDLLVLFPAGRPLATLAAALTTDLGPARVEVLHLTAPAGPAARAGVTGRARSGPDGMDAPRGSGRAGATRPADGDEDAGSAAGAVGVGGGGTEPGRGLVVPADLGAEAERRMGAVVDLGGLGPFGRAVVGRVVLVTGDERWADDLVVDEDALARGADALRRGAPVVVDVEALAAALPQVETICGLRDDLVELFARREGTTRVAAGLRLAARAAGRGAVHVVGTDPAALAALLDLDAGPALVIGLPAGWAGAVEAKQALRAAGLPAVTNRSRRGGTDAAAAAVEALLRDG